MNKIAITGASGYLGSHLVNYFLNQGWNVIALSRRPVSIPDVSPIPYSLAEAAPKLSGQGIDVLVHAAHDFTPSTWSDMVAMNVEGTRRLFTEAKTAGIPRLLFISSLSAFEGTRSLYGKAKLAAEDLARKEGACVIRSGLIYGGAGGGLMKALEQTARTKTWSPIIAHGSSRIHPVHIDDLSELLYRMASVPTWPPPQPVYIAAHRQGWTLADIVRQLAHRAGRTLHLIPLPWPIVWGGLRFLEMLGLRLSFRSDSVLGLACPNPDIAHDKFYWPGLAFRDFRDGPECR